VFEKRHTRREVVVGITVTNDVLKCMGTAALFYPIKHKIRWRTSTDILFWLLSIAIVFSVFTVIFSYSSRPYWNSVYLFWRWKK